MLCNFRSPRLTFPGGHSNSAQIFERKIESASVRLSGVEGCQLPRELTGLFTILTHVTSKWRIEVGKYLCKSPGFPVPLLDNDDYGPASLRTRPTIAHCSAIMLIISVIYSWICI